MKLNNYKRQTLNHTVMCRCAHSLQGEDMS